MPHGPGGVSGQPPRRAAAPVGTVTSSATAAPPLLVLPLRVRIGRMLGITSPRRAALLVVIICAMALSVTVPLRNYVSQRSELAAVREQQEVLGDQVAELERRRDLLVDPRHVEAQARERLRYVQPGETPYVVQLPAAPPKPRTGGDSQPEDPWFTWLWNSIVGG